MKLSDRTLSALVRLARRHIDCSIRMKPGDLVVEWTSIRATPDPDAIGWFVDCGMASTTADNTGPRRLVHDIRPLSGRCGMGEGFMRWENAEFAIVSRDIADLVAALLEVP